jgi:peptidyl-prolyl cis-trans isomerase A (cyclophilin A)
MTFKDISMIHRLAPMLLSLCLPLLAQSPRVAIETELGTIEVSLEAIKAPATTANFLRYIEVGAYTGGLFHRTVTKNNQPQNKVKIEVIQGGTTLEGTGVLPIPLERTRDTGLHHLDGTLSMARDTPDSATSDFFICIGDQPELDFGGKSNPDGQGFAAFGRVVKGMEIVRRIQARPAKGQDITPPVKILTIRRLINEPSGGSPTVRKDTNRQRIAREFSLTPNMTCAEMGM